MYDYLRCKINKNRAPPSQLRLEDLMFNPSSHSFLDKYQFVVGNLSLLRSETYIGGQDLTSLMSTGIETKSWTTLLMKYFIISN